MTRRLFAAIAMSQLLWASAGASARGQLPSDQTVGVLTAAIEGARKYVPPGRLAIGFSDSVNVSADQGSAIGRATNAVSGSLKTSRVCTGHGAGFCHLIGVGAFVQVTNITVVADTAHVMLTILDETESMRQPIHYQWLEAAVVRAGNSWRTLAVKRIRET